LLARFGDFHEPFSGFELTSPRSNATLNFEMSFLGFHHGHHHHHATSVLAAGSGMAK
jgi:hypothetical protein